MSVGAEEGGPCPECGVKGLRFEPAFDRDPSDGCSCHINPPCGYCMSITLYCEACDFKEEEP